MKNTVLSNSIDTNASIDTRSVKHIVSRKPKSYRTEHYFKCVANKHLLNSHSFYNTNNPLVKIKVFHQPDSRFSFLLFEHDEATTWNQLEDPACTRPDYSKGISTKQLLRFVPHEKEVHLADILTQSKLSLQYLLQFTRNLLNEGIEVHVRVHFHLQLTSISLEHVGKVHDRS